MNNLTYGSKNNQAQIMDNYVDYKFKESTNVDPEVLKSLIEKFKTDYKTVVESINELNNYYSKKEIYDAMIMLVNVEKSVENI